MSKETGGPAFPFEYHNQTNKAQPSFFSDGFVYPDGSEQYAGMTLRDYFAAKLMPAIIGTLNGPVVCEEAKGDFDYYATTAYKMADAMIRARGQ